MTFLCVVSRSGYGGHHRGVCGFPAVHDHPGSDPHPVCPPAHSGGEGGGPRHGAGVGQLGPQHHHQPHGDRGQALSVAFIQLRL